MIKKLLFCVLIIMILSAQAQVVPTISFVNFLSADPSLYAVSTALDANSKVYVAGRISAGTENIVVQCTDSTGAILWTYPYDNGGYDSPNKIKVDALGYTYVTAVSYNVLTGKDYVTIKIDPSGINVWTYRYDGGVGGDDESFDLSIDSNYDVYVTGKSKNSNGDFDVVTIKINGSNGTLNWLHSFNPSGFDDVGVCLTLAVNQSYVIVGSDANSSGSDTDIEVYQLNAITGAQNWIYPINGSANSNDHVSAIILAGSNVVIAGTLDNAATGKDYLICKLDAFGGSNVWTQTYDYSSANEVATSLVRDSTGNIVVTGFSSASGFYEYHTVFYDSLGNQGWINRKNTKCTSINVNPVVVCDTIAHHFYISGEIENASRDVLVYQLTPGGNTGWQKTFDRPSINGTDVATSLVVNGNGVVFVSANSINLNNDYDLSTIKITQTPVYFPVNYNFVSDTFSNSHLFYPNTGEILDTAGSPANEVLFYTKFTYPNQYVLKDRISFCEFHKDNDTITPQDSLSRVDMIFMAANSNADTHPFNFQQDNYLNYYMSHTGSSGKTHVLGASHLMVPEIYPSVDLHYTSNAAGGKYFFVVKPGGNPEVIRIKFDGATSTTLNSGTNDLKISSALGSWELKKPKIYNVSLTYSTMALSTNTVTGTAGWFDLGGNIYTFETGTFSPFWPLVIEIDQGMSQAPNSNTLNLKWSTYVGGGNDDAAEDIISDSNNNLFVAGKTNSNNFPAAGLSVFQSSLAGSSDGFIDKYNALGQRLWSTFIGGSQNDEVSAIDIAPNGDIYAVGTSHSFLNTFNKTGASNSSSPSGYGDGFIFQLAQNGLTRNWLTYYGGSDLDVATGCKFDNDGNFFLIGFSRSKDLPIISSSAQYTQTNTDVIATETDGFIARFDKTSFQITWSTYLGAATATQIPDQGGDVLLDLDFDETGDLYVVGWTHGGSFPNVVYTSPFGVSSNIPYANGGRAKGIITRFTNDGYIVWSTCFGGDGWDYCTAVKINDGNTYVTGIAEPLLYPLLNSGDWFYNATTNGLNEMMFLVFDFFSILRHSTFLGGAAYDAGWDLDVDVLGTVYVSGRSKSANFPSPLTQPANGYIEVNQGDYDYVIYALQRYNTNLVWATDVGGTGTESEGYIAIDGLNRLHLTGSTGSSTLFPLFNDNGVPYYDNTQNGNTDVSVTRFELGPVNFVGLKEDHRIAEGIFVYPNPAQTSITVKLGADKTKNSYFYIYNMMGQMVMKGILDAESNIINLSPLAQGAYIFEIKNKEGKSTVKFIKNE